MKKIGLVTLHRNNFGSILQCFSVKRYIESLGYECVVIEIYGKQYLLKMKIELIYDLVITFFSSPRDFLQFFKLRKASSIEGSYLSETTKEYMDNFVNYQLSPKQYTVKQLKKIGKSEDYVAFIVGSDQVWNSSRKISKFYFLDFAPDYKKIALAPSFGISKIPQRYVRNISTNLKKFRNLSVREETGAEIIFNLTGKSAIRLADPTLIYDKNQWRQIIGKKESDEEFLFLHFLSEPSLHAKKLIRDLSDRLSIKFVLFGYKYDCFDSQGNIQFVDGGPLDYVRYVSNSCYVFTDSYHTTLFSINLEKQFLTFDRNHLHQYSQKSRVVDLLMRYGLIERFVEKGIAVEELKCMNEWKSEEILSSDRELLKKYIVEEIECVCNN